MADMLHHKIAVLYEAIVKHYHEAIPRAQKIWTPACTADLKSRRELGDLLNDVLGPPHQRMPGTAAVVKQVCTKLGIGEAELRLIRRYAFHCNEATAAAKKLKALANWALVKDELKRQAKLSPELVTVQDVYPTSEGMQVASPKKRRPVWHDLDVADDDELEELSLEKAP